MARGRDIMARTRRNHLYAWDEISNTIQRRDPEDVFRCNAEGGWISAGWASPDNEYGITNPVEIRTNGRHTALETWALNIHNAHLAFMTNEIYREYDDEKAG